MDNNLTNPTIQTGQGQTAQSAPTQPVTPMAQQPQSQVPQQESPVNNKSHPMRTLLIMIVFSLVVILALVIYLSFINKQPEDTFPIQTQTPRSTPTPATTEEELNSIDVGNVDNDLKEVDADLQGL